MLSPLSDLQPDPTPLHHEVDTTALGDNLLFIGCCKLVNNTTLHLQDKAEGIVFRSPNRPTSKCYIHYIQGNMTREGVAKLLH